MKHDTRSVAITTGANVTFAYCELLSVCALGCIVRQRTNGRVDTPSTHLMDSAVKMDSNTLKIGGQGQ